MAAEVETADGEVTRHSWRARGRPSLPSLSARSRLPSCSWGSLWRTERVGGVAMAGVLSYESLVHAMAGAVVSGVASAGAGGGAFRVPRRKGSGDRPGFVLLATWWPGWLLPPGQISFCFVFNDPSRGLRAFLHTAFAPAAEPVPKTSFECRRSLLPHQDVRGLVHGCGGMKWRGIQRCASGCTASR